MYKRTMALVVLLFGLVMPLYFDCVGKAAVRMHQEVNGVEAEEDEDTDVRLAVITGDESQISSPVMTLSTGDGKVTGDGVRLRDTPSSKGTVLELMYKGELVLLKNMNNANWPKIKRCKTGTIGYVNIDYVVFWN
ncbi:MAG: SH3 domain-containing protein [Lachnospiraceae bacterium]|nr:SH3 domain-containing protein [Lachnospiraceae bacterium]